MSVQSWIMRMSNQEGPKKKLLNGCEKRETYNLFQTNVGLS